MKSFANGIAAGSPGPFDKKKPSGFHANKSSIVENTFLYSII